MLATLTTSPNNGSSISVNTSSIFFNRALALLDIPNFCNAIPISASAAVGVATPPTILRSAVAGLCLDCIVPDIPSVASSAPPIIG